MFEDMPSRIGCSVHAVCTAVHACAVRATRGICLELKCMHACMHAKTKRGTAQPLISSEGILKGFSGLSFLVFVSPGPPFTFDSPWETHNKSCMHAWVCGRVHALIYDGVHAIFACLYPRLQIASFAGILEDPVPFSSHVGPLELECQVNCNLFLYLHH